MTVPLPTSLCRAVALGLLSVHVDYTVYNCVN